MTAVRVSARGGVVRPLEESTLTESGFCEADLEEWVVQNPALLGDDLMVVATQVGRWQSDAFRSGLRLDVLALDRSARPVVVELKRGAPRDTHLQALNYCALVDGCDWATLGAMHREWMEKRGKGISLDEAMARLRAHASADEVASPPRILLVTEYCQPEMLATLDWMSSHSPDLSMEVRRVCTAVEREELTLWTEPVWPLTSACTWR